MIGSRNFGFITERTAGGEGARRFDDRNAVRGHDVEARSQRRFSPDHSIVASFTHRSGLCDCGGTCALSRALLQSSSSNFVPARMVFSFRQSVAFYG